MLWVTCVGWLVGPGDPSCPPAFASLQVLFLGPLLQGWVFQASLLGLQLQAPPLEREATGTLLYSLWGALPCFQQPWSLHGVLQYLWAFMAPRSPCTCCRTGVPTIDPHTVPPMHLELGTLRRVQEAGTTPRESSTGYALLEQSLREPCSPQRWHRKALLWAP